MGSKAWPENYDWTDLVFVSCGLGVLGGMRRQRIEDTDQYNYRLALWALG